ncbi:hypothetical protein LTS12_029533, partial [Elasticomyces elasticus]
MGERSSTPSIVLEKDERDEFLRRENEFQDQIAERESHIETIETSLREAREELRGLKENSARSGKDNDKLNTEINELRMQLEKVSYEGKEASITMDSLREANGELTAELDDIKQQLLDVRMKAKETTAALDEKEKKKSEKMAKMMAGFNLGGEVFSDNERKLQDLIQRIDSLHNVSEAGETIAPDDIVELRASVLETQGFIRQAELTMNDRGELGDLQDNRRAEVERRLADLEREHESLLERNLGEGDAGEIRERLEKLYASRKESELQAAEELRGEITNKDGELNKLRESLADSQSRVSTNGAAGKNLQQQIAEFDAMKKSLLVDL